MCNMLYWLYQIIHHLHHLISFLTKHIYSIVLRGGFKKLDGYLEYPCKLSGTQFIEIGKNSVVLKDTILNAWSKYENQSFNPSIKIGENSFIGEHAHISACKSVTIGNNVLTGRYVFIADNNHGHFSRELLDEHPLKRPLHVKNEIIIEDNVWIGEHVCILSGVTIGKGSVISANAVVTKSVPAYSLVGGVPGRVIKSYSAI